MADFVKKGALGYSPVRGGYSDYECSHVILTKDEYDELLREIEYEKKKRSSEVEEIEKRTERVTARIQKEADDKVFRIKQYYVTEVESLKQQLEEAEWDANTQKNLNKNLLRITRERANAKKGIANKKERSGYIVLNSRQYNQRYKEYSGNRETIKEVMVWKTTIETPYDASLPINQIKGEIFEDLIHRGVLVELRVKKYSDDRALKGGGEYTTFEDDEGRAVNGIYNTQYNANYKSGFWEIDIFHTKSIAVPPEMRPPQRR